MSQIELGHVVGVAHTTWRFNQDADTLEEEIFHCVQRALANAGLSMDDVTGIVTGSSDQLDGRSISMMLTSGSVGGPGREIVNVSSSGEHALVLAAMRMASGRQRVHLVVSWGCPSEADLDALDVLKCEPFFLRDLGVGRIAAQAMAASTYVDRFGLDVDMLTSFVDSLGVRDPSESLNAEWLSWPIRSIDLPPLVNGVTALVLGTNDVARDLGQRSVRIAGMGWQSGSYRLEDREYNTAASGADAVRRAMIASGSTLEQCVATEWHFLNPFHAFETIEALDLAPPGGGATWFPAQIAKGNFGTSYAGDTLFSTGLDRVAALVDRLIGFADARRDGSVGPVSGLAHAVNGFTGQGGTAFVMEVSK